MASSASHAHVLDLLAEAATFEIESVRLGRLLAGATSHWMIEKDLYAGLSRSAPDQNAKAGAEDAFASSCFVLAELLEQSGPRYEQAFDLMATHYELAYREQHDLDPSGVADIRKLISSFESLPPWLDAVREIAEASAGIAGTLAVTAPLYPPNNSLQSALLRVESLQREMIAIYRAIRERYSRLVEKVGPE
jgi:hypothetical protein